MKKLSKRWANVVYPLAFGVIILLALLLFVYLKLKGAS